MRSPGEGEPRSRAMVRGRQPVAQIRTHAQSSRAGAEAAVALPVGRVPAQGFPCSGGVAVIVLLRFPNPKGSGCQPPPLPEPRLLQAVPLLSGSSHLRLNLAPLPALPCAEPSMLTRGPNPPIQAPPRLQHLPPPVLPPLHPVPAPSLGVPAAPFSLMSKALVAVVRLSLPFPCPLPPLPLRVRSPRAPSLPLYLSCFLLTLGGAGPYQRVPRYPAVTFWDPP